MAKSGRAGVATEIDALKKVLAALVDLDEKQRAWVIASAVSNLGIVAALPASGVSGLSTGGTGATAIPGEPGSKAHARAFLKSKSPKTTIQQVACLAYYLTYHRDLPHFKTRDISELNTDAAGSRISNPSQVVGNATHQNGFLAQAGGGKTQLTGFGEDVVNALPDQEAVKTVVGAAKPRKRRASRKAKAKKA